MLLSKLYKNGDYKMIVINTLNVGDTVYYVSKTLNYPRTKHTIVVDDVEYYRYDERYTYAINQRIVSGYVDTVVTGVVDQYDINPRQYYFYNDCGTLLDYAYDSSDTSFVNFSFLTMNEAEEFIKAQKAKDKE
jgi:hypothetical protein